MVQIYLAEWVMRKQAMTKKEFNIAIKECKSTRCFYCEAKSICNAVNEKIGLSLGSIANWKSLNLEQKILIMGIKEKV